MKHNGNCIILLGNTLTLEKRKACEYNNTKSRSFRVHPKPLSVARKIYVDIHRIHRTARSKAPCLEAVARIDVFRNSGVWENKGCWRIQQAPRVRKKAKKGEKEYEKRVLYIFLQYHIYIEYIFLVLLMPFIIL